MHFIDSPLWNTLLGGLLAIAGGLIGAIYAAKTVRKNRMEELIAERKIAANAEAYSYVKEIQGMFVQAAPEATRAKIFQREEWFFSNRLFLPNKFPKLWLTARNDLGTYCLMLADQNKDNAKVQAIEQRIKATLTAAILEIYADMKLQPIDLGQPSEHAA